MQGTMHLGHFGFHPRGRLPQLAWHCPNDHLSAALRLANRSGDSRDFIARAMNNIFPSFLLMCSSAMPHRHCGGAERRSNPRSLAAQCWIASLRSQ